MASVGKTFLDTNVLVYYNDDGEPEKQRIAKERLRTERQASELVVSTQVLQELYATLTRGANPIRPPVLAERAVREVARMIVVPVDQRLIFSAIEEHRRSRIAFWDALVVGAAQSAGCTRLLTEDLDDGQMFGDVVVENPFRDVKPARRRR